MTIIILSHFICDRLHCHKSFVHNGAVVQERDLLLTLVSEKGTIVFLEPENEGTLFVAANRILNFIIH